MLITLMAPLHLQFEILNKVQKIQKYIIQLFAFLIQYLGNRNFIWIDLILKFRS
jgi:hypothetical protein